MYNKNHQSDFANVSPFVQKDTQKLPDLLRSCGWHYMQNGVWQLKLIFSILIILFPAFASANEYQCTIKRVSSLADSGYIENKYEEPYLSKTFRVNKSTGVMTGIVQNTLGGVPKVVQAQSKDWSYKAVTHSVTNHTDVYYLFVKDLNGAQNKPFMFIQSGYIFHGLCE
ncbi:MAG: hypothetical protein ACI88H_001201 [Cocleimonas sp.]|jgi:hypothetical protein